LKNSCSRIAEKKIQGLLETYNSGFFIPGDNVNSGNVFGVKFAYSSLNSFQINIPSLFRFFSAVILLSPCEGISSSFILAFIYPSYKEVYT